jgi:hypothetical protein
VGSRLPYSQRLYTVHEYTPPANVPVVLVRTLLSSALLLRAVGGRLVVWS